LAKTPIRRSFPQLRDRGQKFSARFIVHGSASFIFGIFVTSNFGNS
jgi:hypothetical protein